MKPPIFVIGSGRSGTTVLFDALSRHPDLAWVCNLTNRAPWAPSLARLSRSPLLRKHRVFSPAHETIEGYAHNGFDRSTVPYRGEDSIDVDSVARKMSRYFEAHCDAFGRDRLVSKNTANCTRLELIERIFPDAQFVHIYRHPYAVMSSLLKVGFWPDLDLWWSDKTPNELAEEGMEPIEIAAIHWDKQVRRILEAKERIPASRFFQISYEQFVDDPSGRCEAMFSHLELPYDSRSKAALSTLKVRKDSVDKWKALSNDRGFDRANVVLAEMADHFDYALV